MVVRDRDHRPALSPIAMVHLLRLLPESQLHMEFLGDDRVQGPRLTRSARTKIDHQEERSVPLEIIKRQPRATTARFSAGFAGEIVGVSTVRIYPNKGWIRQHILRQEWIRQHILQQELTRRGIPHHRDWTRQRGLLCEKDGRCQDRHQ